MDRAETGRRGEGAAARLYSQRGCTVLARNYHTRYGELDLILRDQQEGLSSARSRPVRRVRRMRLRKPWMRQNAAV